MNKSKTFLLFFAVGAVSFCFLLMPHDVFAAQLVFKTVPNNASGEGSTIIEVRIDPQSKNLNVVEGVINFQGPTVDKLSVAVETGGLVLTLWPTAPNYLPAEKSIRFSGGVPGGFNQEGLLFRLRLSSIISGNITISWAGGTAYLNDGLGTKEPVVAELLNLNLTQQSQSSISTSSPDIIPPYFDTVEIGQDPNTYDGKYFVSFHATDDISGVARYEVKEGQTTTEVLNGVYVFKDQSRNTFVTITAYDQAGNSKTIEIPARFNWIKDVILVSIFVGILLVVLLYGYKKIIKK